MSSSVYYGTNKEKEHMKRSVKAEKSPAEDLGRLKSPCSLGSGSGWVESLSFGLLANYNIAPKGVKRVNRAMKAWFL